MNYKELEDISLLGKMAFTIKAIENYCLEIYPKENWNTLFKRLYSVTSTKWIDEEWFYPLTDIIPECLDEINNYSELNNNLSKKENIISELEFNYYKKLYSNKSIYKDLNFFLNTLHDIVGEYLYCTINDHLKYMNNQIIEIINYIRKNNIEIPNIENYKFSNYNESKPIGWGNNFDSTKFSKLDFNK